MNKPIHPWGGGSPENTTIEDDLALWSLSWLGKNVETFERIKDGEARDRVATNALEYLANLMERGCEGVEYALSRYGNVQEGTNAHAIVGYGDDLCEYAEWLRDEVGEETVEPVTLTCDWQEHRYSPYLLGVNVESNVEEIISVSRHNRTNVYRLRSSVNLHDRMLTANGFSIGKLVERGRRGTLFIVRPD